MKKQGDQSVSARFSYMMGSDQLATRLRHLRKQSRDAGRLYDIMQSDAGKWMLSYIEGELASVRTLYRAIPMGVAESLELFRAAQYAETMLMEIVSRLKNTPESREVLDKEIEILDNRLRKLMSQPDDGSGSLRLVPPDLKQ